MKVVVPLAGLLSAAAATTDLLNTNAIPDSTAVSQQQQQALPPPIYGWAPASSGSDQGQSGFTLQSGYEGFLLPNGIDASLEPLAHSLLEPLGALGAAGAGAGLLHSLLPFPKLGLKILSKAAVFFSGLLFLLLLGGAVTTAVCTFTPICTITFLGLGFSRESMRSYLTPDRLTLLTNFVHGAIDKYKALQRSTRPLKEKKRRRR